MVCGIVNGVVRVWLLAFITSFLMAIVIVLVQWAMRSFPERPFTLIVLGGVLAGIALMMM
jgi:hypothetical protein